MIVLAVETATRDGSVALARDGRVVAEARGNGAQPHAARLPGDALALLEAEALALSDVDVFAVCLGPGGFTGLRVGIASAQGLAFATGRPIVGISALDALGVAALEQADAAAVAGVWMDAARSEVFAVRYRRDARQMFGIQPIDTPVSATPADVRETWAANGAQVSRWIGDGALRYRQHLAGGLVIEPTPLLAPIVARLATIAAAAGLAGHPHALRPIYIRPPDAELARMKRSAGL
jgi:tRNA threonylcarbamoyladenosine biosynthesis protein TsaB